MSFLSGLLGMMPVVGPLLSGLGQVAGGAAKGSSDQRMSENQQMLGHDALQNQQYGTQQNAQMQAGGLDLQRQGFSEDARGNRAKQALIASILQNFQPGHVGVSGVKDANLTGGVLASLGNAGSQASLAQLYKDALSAQMTPDHFSGGEILHPPTLSQPKGSGVLEKVLGGVGLGGSLLGALSKNPDDEQRNQSGRPSPYVLPGGQY